MPNPIRIYQDEDFWEDVAPALRRRGWDVVTTREMGRGEASDEDQMEYAAQQGRAIATFNRRDFLPIATRWFYEGKAHHGVIISRQEPIGEIIRRMQKLMASMSDAELRDTVRYLEEFK